MARDFLRQSLNLVYNTTITTNYFRHSSEKSFKKDINDFTILFVYRLRDAWTCPANGSQLDQCNCEAEDYKLSGGSYFSKIRINLSTMKIIGEFTLFKRSYYLSVGEQQSKFRLLAHCGIHS